MLDWHDAQASERFSALPVRMNPGYGGVRARYVIVLGAYGLGLPCCGPDSVWQGENLIATPLALGRPLTMLVSQAPPRDMSSGDTWDVP